MKHAIIGAVALAAIGASPAFAADQTFQGEFDPVPHDNSTRDDVVGTGTISATLLSGTLTVHGQFSGLSSAATAAHLRMGAAMGVPGPVIGNLGATAASTGEISGSVKLNAAQIAALKNGALYIELDSAKAPDGNSWGWLEDPGTDRR
jgi:hypothetical protein